MNNTEQAIDKAIADLTVFFDTYNLLSGVFRGDYYFDEPKQYYFTTKVNNTSPYFKKGLYRIKQIIYAGGNSFTNKKLALLKCLGEAMERICQETFSSDKILFETYNKLSRHEIGLPVEITDVKIKDMKLGWVRCTNLQTKEHSLIPAQFAHYSFASLYNEPAITSLISTGGAAGTSYEETILTGLYEVIERDAFTTTYFVKAPVIHLDIDSMENKEIQEINLNLKHHLLEWHVFDITNDLEIPVYLTLLIDRTGIGPAVTSGASASFNPIQAIIKSVSEATMSRPWIRASLSDNRGYHSIMNAETRGIRRRLERGLYWFFKEKIAELSFWLDIPKTTMNKKLVAFSSSMEELKILLLRLKELDFSVYFSDLTHEEIRPFGFKVYKVIIPKLHGLYLDDTKKVFDAHRLNRVASYFNIPFGNLNPIPHPFL